MPSGIYEAQSDLAIRIEIYIEQFRHLVSEHETTHISKRIAKFRPEGCATHVVIQ